MFRTSAYLPYCGVNNLAAPWWHMLKDKGPNVSDAALYFPVPSKLDLAFYPSGGASMSLRLAEKYHVP